MGKNCLLIQANRAFVILDFICALVAAVLDIVFAVMLCVKGGTDCCSKCCGVGGIVLTVFCMILSIISIALGAGVDFDGADMNGGGVCIGGDARTGLVPASPRALSRRLRADRRLGRR